MAQDIEVDDPFYLDVEAYSEDYKGRNLMLRLLYIAQNCIGPMYNEDLELEALQLAYDLIRHQEIMCDMHLFTVISEKIEGRLGEAYVLDEQWRSKKNNDLVTEDRYLRNNLERATDELEKDQIAFRLEFLHYQSGQMPKISRQFTRQEESIKASMATLLVALETRNFLELRHRSLLRITYYNEKGDFKFQLDCIKCIADLLEKKYYAAGEGFIELWKDIGRYDYIEVISSEDIVMYGLVCAMATFHKSKLQNTIDKIIDRIGGLADHLEDVIKPFGAVDYLIDVINHLLAGRFNDCMRLLEKQRPRLVLNMYLGDHVEILFPMMRDVDFLNSFSTILLDSFTLGIQDGRLILDSTGITVTETQLKRLILEGKIQVLLSLKHNFPFLVGLGKKVSKKKLDLELVRFLHVSKS